MVANAAQSVAGEYFVAAERENLMRMMKTQILMKKEKNRKLDLTQKLKLLDRLAQKLKMLNRTLDLKHLILMVKS